MEKQKESQIENPIYSIDEKNKNCADCNSENPTFISVNHGITLCEKCAQIHLNLGKSISYIRKIDDEYDTYLLSFFTFGSNSKFLNMIEQLKINSSLPIEVKYKTFGMDYYRRLLKAKVLGQKLFDPDFNNPNEIKENIENNYPEFENYELKIEQNNNKKEKKNFFGKIKVFSKNLGNKIQDMHLKDKFLKGTNIAYNNLKKAGHFVAEKSQPATKQIKKGANYVGSHMKDAYVGVKNKISKNKNKDNVRVSFGEMDNNNGENNNRNSDENNNNNNNNNNDNDNNIGIGNNQNLINNPFGVKVDDDNKNNENNENNNNENNEISNNNTNNNENNSNNNNNNNGNNENNMNNNNDNNTNNNNVDLLNLGN